MIQMLAYLGFII